MLPLRVVRAAGSISGPFFASLRPAAVAAPIAAPAAAPLAVATARGLHASSQRQLAVAAPSRERPTAASARQRDVEELVRADHASILELWDRFQALSASQKSGAGASTAGSSKDVDLRQRQQIANELIREIAIHSVAEEVTIYPELAAMKGEGEVEIMFSQHQEVKEKVFELDRRGVGHPDFATRLQTVIQELKVHAQNEEQAELPLLRKVLTPERMEALGREFEGIKRVVPTRPHPSAPTSSPTLEALVGMMVAPVDKLRDKGRQFAERKVK